MSKFVLVVPAVALAVLAACASEQPATPAPAPVVIVPQQQPAPVVTAPSVPSVVVAQPVSIRPGIGRVDTMTAIPPSAGAGSTTTVSDMRRLGVRMDDGTFQYVDTPGGNIKIGDRVQFTSEGYIRHPVP